MRAPNALSGQPDRRTLSHKSFDEERRGKTRQLFEAAGVDLAVCDPDGQPFRLLVAIHGTRLLELADLERSRFDPVPPAEAALARELMDEWWSVCTGGNLVGAEWLQRLQVIIGDGAQAPRNSLMDGIFDMFDELLRGSYPVAECWHRELSIFLSLTSGIGFSQADPERFPAHESILEVIGEDIGLAWKGDLSSASDWAFESARILSAAFSELE